MQSWDFPGGPVVKTSPSSAGGVGLILSWETEIPHTSRSKSQNTTCNTFNKDLVHIKKKKILKGIQWTSSQMR